MAELSKERKEELARIVGRASFVNLMMCLRAAKAVEMVKDPSPELLDCAQNITAYQDKVRRLFAQTAECIAIEDFSDAIDLEKEADALAKKCDTWRKRMEDFGVVDP